MYSQGAYMYNQKDKSEKKKLNHHIKMEEKQEYKRMDESLMTSCFWRFNMEI